MQKTVLLICEQNGLFVFKIKLLRRAITLKKSQEELQKELNETNIKLEQYQHQIQRLENRIRDQQDSARRKRNHRLITRGAEVESVVPEVRGMSQADFRILVEQIFSLSEVTTLVSCATDQQEGD